MNKVQKAGLALAASVAGLTMAVAPAGVAAADSADAGILSATGCHGTTCIYVNGKGLTVYYAVVTNKKGSTVGRGMISSNYDGATHVGPRLKKGQSWRFDYNRVMRNGNKVCGSIEGIDVACVTIHK
ncbi:hypothetical protein [Streptomyces abikoensis]